MLRGCRHTAAVNSPSQWKHTCNLSDLTVADREEKRRGGVGRHCIQKRVKGERCGR